jgi:hypothetical protein
MARGNSAMTSLLQRKDRTEAQAFFEEAYPFPVVVVALLSLFLADLGVTLAAVAALGKSASGGERNSCFFPPPCPGYLFYTVDA